MFHEENGSVRGWISTGILYGTAGFALRAKFLAKEIAGLVLDAYYHEFTLFLREMDERAEAL